MNILYVAPRYHTNQVPVMRGWYEHNCRVMFMAEYEGATEIHDYVEFYSLKQCMVSRVLGELIDKKYTPNEAEWKKVKVFVPNIKDTLNKIKEFKPDLVIMRDRHLTNMIIYFICKVIGINKCILYLQEPIYTDAQAKNPLKEYMKKKLFPKVSFSPIYYKGKMREVLKKGTMWFVPLVAENQEIELKRKRDYFQNEMINFLEIGKFRDGKNHFFLVDTFYNLRKRLGEVNVKLTIIGQASNSEEEVFCEKLEAYVKEKKLNDLIEIRKNVSFRDMDEIYMKHDVLLFPSEAESAGMVILEAMGNGLCVAASIYCGLACYLDEYKCGYTFDLQGTEELENIITELMSDKNKICEKGKKSLETINNEFAFENYLQALNKLTEKEFNFSLER